MARPFRRLLTALLSVSLPMATALTFAQGSAAPSGLDLDAINRSVDPCHDFYLFACGEWVSRNPIMPEFQKAFACKADVPMVRQNPCRVW